MRRSSRRLIVGAAVTGVLLAGCGTGAERGTGKKASDDALARFHGQELDWQSCPAGEVPEQAGGDEKSTGFEYAKLNVPLDYRNPDGRTIELALNRLPASDQDRRIASLLTNPGGPGESGLAYVYQAAPNQLSSDLLSRYDVIGMDPGGIGKSTPVRCMSARQAARLLRKQKDLVKAAETNAKVCGRLHDRPCASACGRRPHRPASGTGTKGGCRDGTPGAGPGEDPGAWIRPGQAA